MVGIITETVRSKHIVLHSFSASCSVTVKIFEGKSTVSPGAVESFGVSEAEDRAVLATEPPSV